MPALFMRSKLFVPATRPELFDKALASPADAISIDLEDAVPDTRKAEARALLSVFLQAAAASVHRPSIVVRINAIGTPHFADDLRVAVNAGVSLINLPKADSADDVRRVAAALEHLESSAGLGSPIGLLVNIETPASLRRATEIANAHPRVVGLQLGLGDLFEPFGIDRRDIANVHAAMFELRMAAAAADVAACDGAYADIADPAGFRAEAQMAHRLGFIGKSCIHLSQVTIANEVFAPSAEDVDAATRVVEASRQAALDGRGAFTVDGRMIDAPFLARAVALVASTVR